jgi:dolichol-phosphate mannosyltransferase
MDADLSHDPDDISRLLEKLERGADLAIGSRYVPGGEIPHWAWYRRALSRYGNRYTAALLGLDIRDCTSGFRAYRASTLADIHVGTTRSSGYAFMSELALRMSRQGKSLAEVPITFVDRAFGTSKMSARIIAESMLLVTAWGVRERVRRLKARR